MAVVGGKKPMTQAAKGNRLLVVLGVAVGLTIAGGRVGGAGCRVWGGGRWVGEGDCGPRHCSGMVWGDGCVLMSIPMPPTPPDSAACSRCRPATAEHAPPPPLQARDC